ncbi:MAG: SGNH/GDSL hydrolase family protein [Bosea sp. (in: a-proteobacteria)]
MIARLVALGLSAFLLGQPAVAGTPKPADCRAGIDKVPFKAELSALKNKLSRGEPAVIVALGSSSTAGAGASSADASYPSVLEAELRRRLPDADIKVINRGIGGQRARDMLARLQADVLAEKPDLVIWQTGGNDAIHDVGVEKFKKYTRKGVSRLQASGTDVLLMDSQWMPRAERYPNYRIYQAAILEVASETGAGTFRRYDVMKAWADAGRLSATDIIGADGLHMVDASYYCLGVVLADGITKELSLRLGQRQSGLAAPAN